MSEQIKDTNWRKLLRTKYLSGEELPDGDLEVVIEKWEAEPVFNKAVQEEVKEVVLYFKGASKGYILTKRQARNINKVLGTPYVKEWVGKKITIYGKKEKFFGEWMRVLNVKTK
jgi:hypothetical protein